MLKLMSGLLLSFLLCSCFVTRSETDKLQADIRLLKDEIASLQRSQYDTLNEISSRTSVLETVSLKKNADADLDKHQLQTQVQELRGKLEETEYLVQEIQQDKVKQKAALLSSQKEKIPDNKSGHFAHAKKLYDNKKYSEAIVAYDGFITKYSHDKPLLNRAFFFKGNSYFEMAKIADKSDKKARYKDAVLSFQEVLTRFPASSIAPEALFRVGNSLEAMGFPKDAIVFYEEIMTKHKQSSFAGSAKVKLAKLKKPKPQKKK